MAKEPDTGPKPAPGSGKPMPAKPGAGGQSAPMQPMRDAPPLDDKNRTK